MDQKDAAAIENLRQRWLKIKVADIYDVMEPMGYPDQCLDLDIGPLRDTMRVAGPAFTIVGTREPRFGPELPQPEIDDFALFDALTPGCVVVINAESDRIVGHWGEMMSYGARNAGATGVVIDGGTRDKIGILDIEDWSCFARYTSPIESERRWRPRWLQKPIHMSGTTKAYVEVRPGDWIVGDADAVIVIPTEIAADVLAKAEDVSHREELSIADLKKGHSIRDVFGRYHRA